MQFLMLQLFFFLLCNLDPVTNGASAIAHVPVQETDPRSTMYAWRPINIFFIGDDRFRALQQSVVMPNNITELYLYSQSMLNALAFMYREDYPMCDIKLRCSGTYAMTDVEVGHVESVLYGDDEMNHDDDIVHAIRELVEQNVAASVADIVVVLMGSIPRLQGLYTREIAYSWYNSTAKMCSAQKLILLWHQPFGYAALDELRRGILTLMHPTGDLTDARSVCRDIQQLYRMALAQEEGLMCYNTAESCCVPSFFGIFNMRKEPFCAQSLWFHGLHVDQLVLNQCVPLCVGDERAEMGWYVAPPGWVWNEAADYWKKSLLCPEPDDKICAGFGTEQTLGLTYRKFQRTLTYIWDLDDYELPDLDHIICRLGKK